MGNTHDTEVARIEADYIHTKYRTNEDYRWGYTNDRGPETWWIYYPSASGGMQSPIDIVTEEVLFDPELRHNPLQICYTRASATAVTTDDEGEEGGASGGRESMTLVNTGNTARININNASSYICGGPCKDHNYVLEQIHLHWGEEDDEGSEHLINSHPYAAELHLVHWNEDLYDSYEEAVKREDGIVIIAVFVKISEERSNRGLASITELMEDIAYREQSTPLPSVSAKTFLPDDTNNYWTYKGSFTTPPCYETVTWILMHETIPITSRTLAAFRELRSYCENEVRPDDESDGLIEHNTRPLQPSGTRRIYTSEDHHHDHHMLAGEGYEDPFRQATTFSRGSAFPECGVVVVRQCGRA
jgi:carbonic anhydrase